MVWKKRDEQHVLGAGQCAAGYDVLHQNHPRSPPAEPHDDNAQGPQHPCNDLGTLAKDLCLLINHNTKHVLRNRKEILLGQHLTPLCNPSTTSPLLSWGSRTMSCLLHPLGRHLPPPRPLDIPRQNGCAQHPDRNRLLHLGGTNYIMPLYPYYEDLAPHSSLVYTLASPSVISFSAYSLST